MNAATKRAHFQEQGPLRVNPGNSGGVASGCASSEAGAVEASKQGKLILKWRAERGNVPSEGRGCIVHVALVAVSPTSDSRLECARQHYKALLTVCICLHSACDCICNFATTRTARERLALRAAAPEEASGASSAERASMMVSCRVSQSWPLVRCC